MTHGRDSVASYAGRSTAHKRGVLLATQPTRDIIGSRNIYTGSTVDQMPHNFVWYHMFGHQFLCTIPDINRTDYYLMLGTNPKISNGAQIATGANTYKKLNAIRERGGKYFLYQAIIEDASSSSYTMSEARKGWLTVFEDTRSPAVKFADGFGNPCNNGVRNYAKIDGELYLGTTSWCILGEDSGLEYYKYEESEGTGRR